MILKALLNHFPSSFVFQLHQSFFFYRKEPKLSFKSMVE
jgi:hypothetical protein